jgi:hypothetical protein
MSLTTRALGVLASFAAILGPTGCTTSTVVVPVSTAPVEPAPPADTAFEPPAPLGPIFAPGQVRELVPGGAIDWSGKTVRARGAGVLDPGNTDRSLARQMAERAATVVAQRNLLEIIKGIRVDSDSRVQDAMAASDSVFPRVEAIVKGAGQRGPARYDSVGGIVEVELECDLYGEGGVEGAVAPLAAGPQPESDIAGALSPGAREFLGQYSGLLLDGGSAGLKPALFPRIFDDAGNLLLDPRRLAASGASGAHTVQYVGTYDQLLGRADLGPPLMLRVREARGKLGSDAVVGRADAGLLRNAGDGLELLLRTGRIIVKLTQ